MNTKKIAIAVVIAALAVAYFGLDLGQYFEFDYIKSKQAALQDWVAARPWTGFGVFFLVYVAVTALSLPGAAVLTLLGGALFGLWKGLLLVSFASSIGATLAFLVSRHVLRDTVQARFGDQLKPINDGIAADGPFYLVTLRLVPLFPFWLINLAMGLTGLATGVFYLVSQLAMLPGTFVFVNAGTQLASIESPAGILSPGLLLSFALLGVFPLIAKKAVDLVKARKVYEGWDKPATFDRDMIVIGAGSGGLVSAYIAAAVKAKVTLVEKHKMGGDCLNFGCVPSKALIRSAKQRKLLARNAEFGLSEVDAEVDFASVMQRVHKVIERIEPHDSVERYTGLGVEVMQGSAKLVSPWHVDIDGAVLSARSIVIASGAEPFVPPIPGLDQTGYLTSDTIWNLTELPRRLVVLGGGPIGSELTQSFARLGSEVTQVEMLPRIMIREDEEISALVEASFKRDGVTVLTNARATEARVDDGEKVLVCELDGEQITVPFDEILVAVGRKARTAGFGLEEVGVKLTARGTVDVDANLRTNFPNIYAVGDVAGPYQFTHTAAHQAWYAAVNGLFGTFKSFKVDYRVIPWATFTEPEVARVGLNELEAKEQGIAHEVTTFGIDDLDRAIADGEAHGFVKVLTVPGKDTILGVTIVGEHAGDLIAEYVLAMKHKLGLNKVLGTIHIYPTLAEANKYVAGEWRRANQPAKLLEWVAKYHAWRRG
ncbi:MAG: FAD-dependent oxidoreductase [Pseudomonadota bacterium]